VKDTLLQCFIATCYFITIAIAGILFGWPGSAAMAALTTALSVLVLISPREGPSR
jgi:ACR3 family arsenite efflux pump ArsB